MVEQNSSQKRTSFSRVGEHPYGDMGQLIILLIFLVIWILDSFFLKFSTFPADFVPLYIRLTTAGLILVLAVYLKKIPPSGCPGCSEGNPKADSCILTRI